MLSKNIFLHVMYCIKFNSSLVLLALPQALVNLGQNSALVDCPILFICLFIELK